MLLYHIIAFVPANNPSNNSRFCMKIGTKIILLEIIYHCVFYSVLSNNTNMAAMGISLLRAIIAPLNTGFRNLCYNRFSKYLWLHLKLVICRTWNKTVTSWALPVSFKCRYYYTSFNVTHTRQPRREVDWRNVWLVRWPYIVTSGCYSWGKVQPEMP
jgi:hypothetical protein